MNPLRPINMNMINSSPSTSKFKPSSYKEKKENWLKLEKIIAHKYGLEPAGLNRDEKHQIRDFEDELERMDKMVNVLPAQ